MSLKKTLFVILYQMHKKNTRVITFQKSQSFYYNFIIKNPVIITLFGTILYNTQFFFTIILR